MKDVGEEGIAAILLALREGIENADLAFMKLDKRLENGTHNFSYENMIDLMECGVKAEELAKECNVKVASINSMVSRYKGKKLGKYIYKDNKEYVELFKNGMTVEEIACKFNRSKRYVQKMTINYRRKVD